MYRNGMSGTDSHQDGFFLFTGIPKHLFLVLKEVRVDV